MTANRAALAWLAIVAPLAIVLVACALWEPITFDGWNHYLWHRDHDTTLANLVGYARATYEHNNPRFGEVLTQALYAPGPWHALASAAGELALFYVLAALVLGRWPSWRRGDDALFYLLLVALATTCTVELGQMLIYRPYVGNYTLPFAMTIAFALPYRFALERERAGQRWLAAPAMLAAGFVVGTCNEHTGPTLAAFALAVAAIDARRTRTWPRAWMIAGALGVIAGGLALYLAPGQAFRYDGLATQQSIVWRVLDRDPLDYARALISPYVWLGFALPWIAIALAAGAREPMPRARRRALAGLAAASFAILVTLLASPKLGGRLYFAAQLLAIGALVGWLVPRLAPSRARTAAVALSGIVLVLAGWRCVHAYRTVAPESAERVDALEHAVRGGRVELATYSFDPPKPSDAASALAWIVDGRWLVGEDLRIASRRERLEQYYGISIVLR